MSNNSWGQTTEPAPDEREVSLCRDAIAADLKDAETRKLYIAKPTNSGGFGGNSIGGFSGSVGMDTSSYQHSIGAGSGGSGNFLTNVVSQQPMIVSQRQTGYDRGMELDKSTSTNVNPSSSKVVNDLRFALAPVTSADSRYEYPLPLFP